MRDLIFKNLTSEDKRKRIVSSTETIDRQGIHSIIRRHFVYVVREVQEFNPQHSDPRVFIFKERNSREQKERFYCKIKGDLRTINNGKLFLVQYIHSLKINLTALPQESTQA
jgi:hypothetical protein